MAIRHEILSQVEKNLFKKTLKIRLWIALFFGIPLLGGVGLMTYQFIDYQIDVFKGEITNSDWDFGSYIFFFFLVFCHVFIFVYAIPFFIKSYKNNQQTHKIVATAQILNIIESYRSKGMLTYEIITDYITINTYYAVFLNPIKIKDLQPGMKIEIHHLENNFTDIIKIVIV
jgi:hypothetical protein